MPRVLLILPTSTYRAPDFLAAARALGVDIVVASEGDQALAEQMGDGFLQVDCRRPEQAAAQIVEAARPNPLDAVIAADDQGVLVAAIAAQQLGLSHNPPEAVAATRDKALMRRLLAKGGIPQPDFRVVRPGDDVPQAASQIGLPCVVKPVGLSGSRGVIRADDPAAAETAADRIRAILTEGGEDPSGPLLVERYLPGAEVAVEGLLHRGAVEVLALFDKPDPLEGPHFEETLYVTPSRLPGSILKTIETTTQAAVEALGLQEGPIHAELRVDGGRASMLEVAGRSIGGLCSRSLRFGLLSSSLEVVLLRSTLGMPRTGLRRERRASGVMMLPIPAEGTLREVRGKEEALAVPGVTGLEVTAPLGSRVRPLPEGDRYLGFLFAAADTPDDVEGALRDGFSRLEFVIE